MRFFEITWQSPEHMECLWALADLVAMQARRAAALNWRST